MGEEEGPPSYYATLYIYRTSLAREAFIHCMECSQHIQIGTNYKCIYCRFSKIGDIFFFIEYNYVQNAEC